MVDAAAVVPGLPLVDGHHSARRLQMRVVLQELDQSRVALFSLQLLDLVGGFIGLVLNCSLRELLLPLLLALQLNYHHVPEQGAVVPQQQLVDLPADLEVTLLVHELALEVLALTHAVYRLA